jgi:hypothetical protein
MASLRGSVKVVPQASNCRELEVGGRIYRRSRGGLFDLPERAAKYAIKTECAQEASLSGTTRTGIGYRCTECGFGSFFATCSRCGGTAVREVVHA